MVDLGVLDVCMDCLSGKYLPEGGSGETLHMHFHTPIVTRYHTWCLGTFERMKLGILCKKLGFAPLNLNGVVLKTAVAPLKFYVG